MKLFRFGEPGKEKPGILLNDGQKLDVSAFGEDFNELFFSSMGIERLKKWVKINSGKCRKVKEGIRLGPAIARPSKIVCIGLNFADHADESNADIPEEPIVFLKQQRLCLDPTTM